MNGRMIIKSIFLRLLNYPTTKGRSVGIEGGFGIFGSIGSDWKMLKIAKK